MSLDTVRVFAIRSWPGSGSSRQKLREQERETPREYLDRESHYVWGKRYLLKVIEADARRRWSSSTGRMLLRVRPGTSKRKRQAIVSKSGIASRSRQPSRH